MAPGPDRERPPLTLPFVHLNLRWNPFGEPSQDDRPALAVVDPATLERWRLRLATERFALQFLGDAGHGKSTHLHALRVAFPAAPFTYVPEDEPARLPPIARGVPYVVDEVQRLGRWRRVRIFRRAEALVLGSHEDLTAELARVGFAVETVRLAGPDRATLGRILRARVEWARRGPGPVPTFPDPTLDALRARFGGDVRAMEAWLYDRLQDMREIGDVEV